ncbi:ATP-dependent DNA helicase [Trichonephila clavipes]|uniref:ATP-dependent DNA helicase n=1 Tax=Trichonephila clavipes TaxID=2585209 RepID=A0A8X6SJV0_TRICX|nr:ATP-dependent DNA helicase [Trichonephila clavipes]
MLNKLGAIAKKKENIMSYDDFYDLMRRANEEQREILFHTMHHLISTDEPMREPLLIYLTGPAGSGKTFVIKGIMEIYNRFSDTDGIFNAYIACASTGKAATAIGGSTVHSALSISLEKANQYRTLFKFVKVLIIDEISMVSAELLEQINARLKQITGLFTKRFWRIRCYTYWRFATITSSKGHANLQANQKKNNW